MAVDSSKSAHTEVPNHIAPSPSVAAQSSPHDVVESESSHSPRDGPRAVAFEPSFSSVRLADLGEFLVLVWVARSVPRFPRS